MSDKRTIARLWRDAVAAGRTRPAYLEQRGEDWLPISWAEAAEHVEGYANGLLALGVRKGDAFAILGTTRVEWALFDFALGQVGAIGAAIYANSSPKDVRYILEHSDSVGVLCEDESQLAKVESVRDGIGRLEHVLTFGGLEELAERGRAYAAEHPEALREAAEAVEEDDLFTYIYTSGTTGPPKGCMISNRNYYAMVAVVDDLESFTGPDDTMLLYLPLAHNFGRLMHLSGPYVGYTIAFLPDPLQAAAALATVKPTVFPSVPRVYEKIHTAVVARFDEAAGVRRKLIDWALAVGRRVSVLRRSGRPVPRSLALQFRLADKLVYGKVKARLGGRLRTAISGGAPLALEIAEFFHAIDILLVEGYGLTECTTAATTSTRSTFRFGTVGRALPGFELRLAEDGELLVRSETIFQGYYKDPEATAEVLTADGWLLTGDIAAIDEDGYVTITDRKKDIIVTAGGKNVAPQNLENDLKSSKYVSQALVVGDRKPYVAALVTLDAEEIGKWAAAQGLAGGVSELSRESRVRELVQGVVDAVNAERSRYEQVRRFSILPRDFTMEDGELTPTLKLRRRVCKEHFAAELEELYAGETLTQTAGV
ncbi:MAG: long-chain fatty acid--CoA ligase [Gaiellaceae bacterium MAG52_C11]|nr:long-chain fatty acid--CoA ligase [Candidatus Gaiellasilicea maunaloa]